MTQMNKYEALAQFLGRGPVVKNAGVRGFTRSQLEKMGIEKRDLKKAASLGFIGEINVRSDQNGGLQNFYCVKVKEEPKAEAPAIEVQAQPVEQTV